MDWLESILYGFVSGLAEILPISLTGHQTIMNHLFGVSQRQPLRDLLVHLAILGAIYLGWREELDLIRRERAVIARHTRGRRNLTGLRTVFDVRLIQTASLPLAILSFLWIATKQLEHSILFVVLFLILNGILLMIPEHLRQANKEARHMSGGDGLLIGLFGALSVLPGLSRLGCSMSIATMRGADKGKSLGWCIILGIPAMIAFAVMDIVFMIATGTGIAGGWDILFCILSAGAAFVGTLVGIWVMKHLLSRAALSGFSYYCWGAAVFAFVLYLIA